MPSTRPTTVLTNQKTPTEARKYYAEEFANVRRKAPIPYMDKLRFTLGSNTADSDQRILTDEDLQHAQQEGEQRDSAPPTDHVE